MEITPNVLYIINIGLYQAKKEEDIEYILEQIGGDIVDYTICYIAKYIERDEEEAKKFIKENINDDNFVCWLFFFIFGQNITSSQKIFEEYFIPQIKETFMN